MNPQSEYGRTPTIFVSSTCYDLKQVRTDIRDFIAEQLGYEAILSEFDSFPLEPEISTVENCIRVVKQRADIFCLIVGGRYGSVADSGKSITNLEYINAKAKGIPIYVFVSKDILAILPIWERNPEADFTNVVDNPQLFEFVAGLRGKENIWVYGFDNSKDIISALKNQLGYLFYDSLKLRRRIHISKLSKNIQEQEGKALKTILEKPRAWEYVLLGEVLEHAFGQYDELKRDLTYGFSFGNTIALDNSSDVITFVSMKMNELTRITDNITIIFNNVIPEAIGLPGEPGDEEIIIYLGERFGNVYSRLLKWGLDFRSISVDEEWSALLDSAAEMCKSVLEDLDDYLVKYRQGMKELILHLDEYTETKESMPAKTIDLSLTLKPPYTESFNAELNKLRGQMGLSFDNL